MIVIHTYYQTCTEQIVKPYQVGEFFDSYINRMLIKEKKFLKAVGHSEVI